MIFKQQSLLLGRIPHSQPDATAGFQTHVPNTALTFGIITRKLLMAREEIIDKLKDFLVKHAPIAEERHIVYLIAPLSQAIQGLFLQ